ncbi:MAG: DsrE family protein [Gammaproteobacteria bacterium]|nr:DsrE family protein [Gammaproteobacteria bacterium]MCK5092925.1 DsrE family protein [Gammaproteobacteria bacterium]
MASERKKAMIVVRKAPHGSIYVQEAQEVMLIVAAYEMELSVVFIDDGVFALKSGQDTKELGTKSFMPIFTALIDWEIENVYIDEDSMKNRGMSEEQIITIGEDEETEELVKPAILKTSEIQALMKTQDTILSF